MPKDPVICVARAQGVLSRLSSVKPLVSLRKRDLSRPIAFDRFQHRELYEYFEVNGNETSLER